VVCFTTRAETLPAVSALVRTCCCWCCWRSWCSWCSWCSCAPGDPGYPAAPAPAAAAVAADRPRVFYLQVLSHRHPLVQQCYDRALAAAAEASDVDGEGEGEGEGADEAGAALVRFVLEERRQEVGSAVTTVREVRSPANNVLITCAAA